MHKSATGGAIDGQWALIAEEINEADSYVEQIGVEGLCE